MARVIALAVVLIAVTSCLCSAQTNVLTYHNDNFHTGQNLSETSLTPGNVNARTFGKLFFLPADGKVEAQPLYVAGLTIPNLGTYNVVFLATEHGTVYAYDADRGAPLWQVSMLGPGEAPSDDIGCFQVSPEIGVTATPVIDLSAGDHGTMYVVAMSVDSDRRYHQRLHALDISSGQEEFGGPVEITATFPGNGDGSRGGFVQFDPKMYKERAALVLSNGVVYTSWASHCDFRPYTGWVMGYDQYTLSQTVIYNSTPNGLGGSLWGAGAGPAVDSTGNLFFQTANGTFDTDLDGFGFPARNDYGNSFLKLSVERGVPIVLDYWTMYNTELESDLDVDLGSGGIMLLPDLTDGTGAVRHLGMGAGKDRTVYVFERDNMGKFDPGGDNTIYQELPFALPDSEMAAPAWFNGTAYFGAVGDRIRAFPMIAGYFSKDPPVTTPNVFPYPGTTPSISANGTKDAILWAIENTDPAVLHAYDATNIGIELYNSNQAPNGRDYLAAGSKWIPPTIADGKVFVPTATGVAVFGLIQ